MRGEGRRKRGSLNKMRAELENYGYTIEDLTDSAPNAAVAGGRGRSQTAQPPAGKRTYWIVRRLSETRTKAPRSPNHI
jgi:hypothetical protein